MGNSHGRRLLTKGIWPLPRSDGALKNDMYSDELSDVLRQQVQPLTKMRQLCDAEDGTKKGLNRGDKYNWDRPVMRSSA